MITRRAILPLSCLLSSCIGELGYPVFNRQPYVDEWRVVAEAPDIAALKLLSIGDRETNGGFANRGDVEVVFDPDATGITVEMQRFTIAETQEQAEAAFGRMEYWGYNSPYAAILDPVTDAAILCFTPNNEACYIRAKFPGAVQSFHDGANFRVTLPKGWSGDLEIVTSDNLGEGIEDYPDRGNVKVTGLSGSLSVDLDSGNVEIALDPSIDHYAGCSASDACELGDPDAVPPLSPFDPACGCIQPTSITVENAHGQASNVLIDIPTASTETGKDHWYNVSLENWGSEFGNFGCTAIIDCDTPGLDCVIDPEFAEVDDEEQAEINYPGEPAIHWAGIQVNATSWNCLDVAYLEHPEDYELEEFPHEQRGNLRVCSGCL